MLAQPDEMGEEDQSRHERDEGTDTDAYDDGAASITPLVLDLTCSAHAPLADRLVSTVSST